MQSHELKTSIGNLNIRISSHTVLLVDASPITVNSMSYAIGMHFGADSEVFHFDAQLSHITTLDADGEFDFQNIHPETVDTIVQIIQDEINKWANENRHLLRARMIELIQINLDCCIKEFNTAQEKVKSLQQQITNIQNYLEDLEKKQDADHR